MKLQKKLICCIVLIFLTTFLAGCITLKPEDVKDLTNAVKTTAKVVKDLDETGEK